MSAAARALLAAPGLLALLSCAAAAPVAAARPAAPEEPACAGLTPPRRLAGPTVTLPASFTAARLGGEVVQEVVIAKDGALVSARLVRARHELLAPFAEAAVKGARFTPASIEGNPVAVRGLVSDVLGTVAKARVEPAYDQLWAFVAAGSSREARWQLAESVERLTLTAHVGTELPRGGRVLARAPSGAERKLLKLPSSSTAADLRETVSAGRFFWKSGEYRLELVADGGRILAATTLTIAPDFTGAIVNDCDRIR